MEENKNEMFVVKTFWGSTKMIGILQKHNSKDYSFSVKQLL